MGRDFACDAAVFILAGGKSTRMRTEKAFVELDGRSLLGRALHLARSISQNVWIVGSREKFSQFAEVVEDVFRERGPLGGIHAALLSSPAESNLMLAVDMPFVTPEFLRYLLSEAHDASQAAVVVPRVQGRSQPLCAIYRREFAIAAENALQAGRNKIEPLFQTVRTRVIEEEELERAGFSPNIFRNLNTPDDVEFGQRRA